MHLSSAVNYKSLFKPAAIIYASDQLGHFKAVKQKAGREQSLPAKGGGTTSYANILI